MRVHGLCSRQLFGWPLVGMASLDHIFLRMMMTEEPQWIRSIIIRSYRISTFQSCANSVWDETMISKWRRSGFNWIDPHHKQREPQDHSYRHSSRTRDLFLWRYWVTYLFSRFDSPRRLFLKLFEGLHLCKSKVKRHWTTQGKYQKRNAEHSMWNISTCD